MMQPPCATWLVVVDDSSAANEAPCVRAVAPVPDALLQITLVVPSDFTKICDTTCLRPVVAYRTKMPIAAVKYVGSVSVEAVVVRFPSLGSHCATRSPTEADTEKKRMSTVN